MTELLNASYILDGVPMPLSPAKMLRECTVEPPLEPDGDPSTVADEHLDQVPPEKWPRGFWTPSG